MNKRKLIIEIIVGLMVLTALLVVVVKKPWIRGGQSIEIDEVHFPDSGFRRYVLEQLDDDKNGWLDIAERGIISSIYLSDFVRSLGRDINSLKGIELFTCLKNLDCSGCHLTELDVSQNRMLRSLYCGDNRLTTLDVSHNPLLGFLSCEGNELRTLDVSQNPRLSYLKCVNNALTELDLRNNPDLFSPECDLNVAVTLAEEAQGFVADPDIHIEISLKNFPNETFREYILENYDEDHDGALSDLELHELTKIDAGAIWSKDQRDNGKVDLRGIELLTALTELTCDYCALSELDVSRNEKLKIISCVGNKLTSLDVSHNPKLETLKCSYNDLTSLDLKNNPYLIAVYCRSNGLTSLLIGECPDLQLVDCALNRLTKLDLSDAPCLNYLYCYSNSLTDLDLSKNFGLCELAAHDNDLSKLNIYNNIGIYSPVIDKGVKLQKRSGEYEVMKYYGKASYEELEDDYIRIKDGRYQVVNDKVMEKVVAKENFCDYSVRCFEIQGDTMILREALYLAPMGRLGEVTDVHREFSKLKLSDSVTIMEYESEITAEEFNEYDWRYFELRIKNGVVTEILID